MKGLKVTDRPDGSTEIEISGEVAEQLGLKVGDRLVWTVADGVQVRKRSARYQLKEGEFESFVVAVPEKPKRKRKKSKTGDA
jgi:hypothetical protein